MSCDQTFTFDCTGGAAGGTCDDTFAIITCDGSSSATADQIFTFTFASTCCDFCTSIPGTLFATLGAAGSCSCLNGQVVTLTLSGSTWTGSLNLGAGCGNTTITMSLTCTGSDCNGLRLALGNCISRSGLIPEVGLGHDCTDSPVYARFLVLAPGTSCGCSGGLASFFIDLSE